MKQATLAREWSLWNQLNLGYSKFSLDSDDNDTPTINSQSEKDQLNEKDKLMEVENGLADLKDRKAKSSFGFYKAMGLASLSLLVLMLTIHTCHHSQSLDGHNLAKLFNKGNQLEVTEDEYDFNYGETLLITSKDADNATVVHEVIEVGVPFLDYGVPVYSQNLLNATFGNCWGHPVTAEYLAPPSNVTFSQVVISLDTWVDGVQYDRLAHLFLDGAEVWRTSTIEPANKLSHSYTQKDLSLYAKLFSEDAVLMFQLDNLLTPRLTGSFNVSLNAFYYNNTAGFSLLPSTDAEESADLTDIIIEEIEDEIIPGALASMFSAREGADQIYPLIENGIEKPPLVYLPDKELSSVVPKLNANTTKVKLELFMSGNSEEEFWWSNVLDEFVPTFEKYGHKLAGHGPCRVINVFSDGVRLSTANPFPVIYTGGLSPALWNPIVSTGAFDVRAVEIDLTPLLPNFWEKPTDLTIEVSNCIDDDLKFGEVASGIGNNWISSANLVTWEDDRIASSTGSMLSFENSTKVTSFGFAPPMIGMLQQIVRAEYINKFNSTLNYTLTNGSSVAYVAESYSDVSQVTITNMKKFGDEQTVITVPTAKHSFAILDALSNDTLSALNYTHSYPITAKMVTLPATVGAPAEIEYEVNVTRGIDVAVAIDGFKALSLKSKENGTSNFTLSPKGNHGTGTMEHNLTITEGFPLGNMSYNRHALGCNGSIIYDNVTLSDTTAKDTFESKMIAVGPISEEQEFIDLLASTIIQVANLEDNDFSDVFKEELNAFYEEFNNIQNGGLPANIENDNEIIAKLNLFNGQFFDF